MKQFIKLIMSLFGGFGLLPVKWCVFLLLTFSS